MHILIVLSFVLLTIVSWVAYKMIRSYRFTKAYANYARKLGFKVYELPFTLFGFAAFKEMKRNEVQHGDANFHYKTIISDYDLAISNSLSKTLIQLVNPDLIKEFYLKANDGYYIKRLFGFGQVSRMISYDNLLLSQGDHWKRRRKLFSEIFNYEFIKQKIPQIHRICRKKINQMEQIHQIGQGVYCYDVSNNLSHIFSQVILQCFFQTHTVKLIEGVDLIDFANEIVEKATVSARQPMSVLMGPNLTKKGLRKADRQINEKVVKFRKVAKQIIEQRIKEIQSEQQRKEKEKDIIQILIRGNNLKKIQQNSENSITIETLINEFATFLVAGSETTMSFTRMMIYELAMHPKIIQKMRQQIAQVIHNDQPTYQELKNLKYMQSVQKQVLRMDSSVSSIFPRIATKNHHIGSLNIQEGMQIAVRIRSAHFKSQIYGDPLDFRPQRWESTDGKSPYSYIPFSAGARNCIGNNLALLENKIFMVELLRRYKNIKIDKDRPKMLAKAFYSPEAVKTTFQKY